ncbi:MAG TPA: YCF48-related protein [Chitinophagales bacterium]|nr:YCF48-related protein [Chitinophagales bacterium]HNF70349.1 YCF48-related protein [Chitinophagales bacterium]HNK97230.1 YCF48-related protein [Chitinophagales bacterium]HNM29443.1 YCF48-related protein [Chitinophagales bacterium]HNO28463.1 YCF48-related protein [Chitinophagales bacterium]
MIRSIQILVLSVIIAGCNSEKIFIPTVRFEEVFFGDAPLNEVYFTSATTGVIVGDEGQFLQSTDGGRTWLQVAEAPIDINYNVISFPTTSIGYVSGDGALLKTVDGGVTWNLIFEGYHFIYTCFPTATIGYAIDGNYVYKSTDGGETWNDIYAYSSCGIAQARAIYFYTASSGYLVDESWSYVATSTSGGNSFTYAIERPSIAYAHTRRAVNGLSYWAAGNDTYYSGMYYTTDGDPIERFSTDGFATENSSYIYAMHSWDGNEFIAIGTSTIALSHDSGETWTEVFDQNGFNLRLHDAAVLENGRYVGIYDRVVYLLTQDCTTCE